ncbi:MAG: glycosyltransferase family 4 protein, partial [Thermodesulfovibrionales bacterium]
MGWGGQEIRIVRESLGMIRRGYRVIIAAPEKSSILKKAREAGITAFPAEFRKKSIPCILAMKSLLEREGVQILNTHSSADSWVATMAAKICKKKPLVIRTRHLSTPVGTSVLSRLIYDTLTDAIITTGEEIRQKMICRNRFRGEKI